MRTSLIFLHLTGVIVWVGGMFFALVCLRPVAAAQLPPPQRLPLLASVLGRFFKAVIVAIAHIIVSGIALIMAVGFARAPLHWHLMMTSGLVMTAIFCLIYFRYFRRLHAGVAAQDWPAAGSAMNGIRQWVQVNLVLGVATIAIAIFGAAY